MSKFEHDGVSSSSLPDRRLASSTEYRRSSMRYIAGLSKSMLWLERRWTRTAARLAVTIPHKRHVLSPVLEAGEMCSFWM
jgi:hypothetical protein